MRYRTYLIFGPPGSGKGTHGRALGSIPRFFHMACGDVFRSLDTRTPLGQEFIAYAGKGLLVPDAITLKLWMARIGDEVGAHTFKPDIDALVLDGIPRNAEQARLMTDLIDVRRIFYLDVPDRRELIARMRKRALKENRFDDANEDVIRRRLATFDEESKPLLAFYGESVISRIDATQEPAKVLCDILCVITSSGTGG